MSALLPAVADPAWHEASRLETVFDKIRPAGAASLPELLAQVDAEFAGFAPLLKVSLPEKALIDCYVEVTAPAAS